MAAQGVPAQMAAAAGTAAAAGAAQLGLGYGLGVVVWQQTAGDDTVWATSLTWAVWIAATSTILGAVTAGRIGRTAGPRHAVPGFALAAAAAVGALLTVALIAVPARTADRADTYTPQTLAAGYAVLGVLIGLLLASWAANSAPLTTNLLATTAWVWLLAVVAVVADLFGGDSGSVRLGVWHPFPGGWFLGNLAWPGALVVLLAALLIGYAVARVALRRGDAEFGVTISGVLGPLVVALAHLVLAPRLTGLRDTQLSAYLVAPYAVLAGLAGSVLAVAVGRTGIRRIGTFRGSAPVRISTTEPAPRPVTRKPARESRPSPVAAVPMLPEPPRKSTVTRPPAKPRVAEFPDAPPVDPWAGADPSDSSGSDDQPAARSGRWRDRIIGRGRAKVTTSAQPDMSGAEPGGGSPAAAAGTGGTPADAVPTRPAGAGDASKPATKDGPDRGGPGERPAEVTSAGADEGRAGSTAAAEVAPAKATASKAAPARPTPAKANPAKAAPTKSAVTKAGKATSAQRAKAGTGSTEPGSTGTVSSATPATGNADDATPAGSQTGSGSGGAAAGGGSGVAASPALWVDDEVPVGSEAARRNPFRKLGRRTTEE